MDADTHGALERCAAPGGHRVSPRRARNEVWKTLRRAGLVEGEDVLTITPDGIEALSKWRFMSGAG